MCVSKLIHFVNNPKYILEKTNFVLIQKSKIESIWWLNLIRFKSKNVRPKGQSYLSKIRVIQNFNPRVLFLSRAWLIPEYIFFLCFKPEKINPFCAFNKTIQSILYSKNLKSVYFQILSRFFLSNFNAFCIPKRFFFIVFKWCTPRFYPKFI